MALHPRARGATCIVPAPFAEVEPIYDAFREGLGPLGLTLDDDQLRAEGPRITSLLAPGGDTLSSVDYVPRGGRARPCPPRPRRGSTRTWWPSEASGGNG